MQLQYIWISKYKNLENVGVNFSNRYRFDFDHEKRLLNKYKTKNHIEDYFPGNISAVTSLVGANGAGKTTILRLIYSFICHIFIEYEVKKQSREFGKIEIKNWFPGFVVIGLEDSDESYLYKGNGVEIADYSRSIEERTIQFSSINDISFPIIAYHSNFIDVNHILSQEITDQELTRSSNISTDFLLKKDYESIVNRTESGDFKKVLTAHKFAEYERQVNFLLNTDADKFPIKKPRYLVLTALPKDIYQNYEFGEETNKVIDYLNGMRETFLTRIIISVLYVAHRLGEIDREFINGLSKMIFDGSEQKPLENFNKQIDLIKTNDFDHRNQLTTFLILLKQVKKIFRGELITEKMLYLDFKSQKNQDDYELKKFWALLKLSFSFSSAFSLSLRHFRSQESLLSSGELCLLNLFSRLYFLKNEISQEDYNNTSGKCITLLMDEIELGLHPQWQKKYFNNLINFLSNNFEGFELQLIFATHSPFLLSDLPSYSNNYFSSDKSHEEEFRSKNFNTLGQQIHSLMKDNFFIRGGIVGEYAVKKFSEKLDRIKQKEPISKSEHDQSKVLFENISDGILRERLLRILQDKKLEEDVKQ